MLVVSDLEVQLHPFTLKQITFSVREGEFFLILGPSGAGKTVLLETLAGIYFPRQGRILLANEDLTLVPPEKRPISIVYQDYALFPHLDVEENIRYALRFARNSGSSNSKWKEIMEFLNISHLRRRYPDTLSGGERQRVALARALVASPRMLLLDEPLSALDPALRMEVAKELKRLNRQLGLTVLMVTHNFSEVFYLGERVAVLIEGRLAQVGTPEEVFRRPVSLEVASFVGMVNLIPLEHRGGDWFLLGRQFHPDNGKGEFFVGVRPEDVHVSRVPLPHSWAGQLENIIPTGKVFELEVRVNGHLLRAYLTGSQLVEEKLRPGDQVHVSFTSEDLCLIKA
ncbi:ABC transporter ATP-binding protein [Desulfothermobacter acidiphilus]|uniref:ABC transporter ATP-binding protein n=1 Tax=Desulfothermobacter acidiphilus TaxID=1938353 RepID=UPI003F8AEB2D